MPAISRWCLFSLGLSTAVACNNPPTAPGPVDFVVVQGPPAAGLPGLPLLDTIRVQVVDATSGQPRRGVRVFWSIAQGDGEVLPLSDRSDRDGLVSARWTLGGTGTNQVQVSTADGASASLTTEATAFKADRLVSTYQSGCGLAGTALWCWGRGFWDHPEGPSDRQLTGWSNAAPALLDDTHGFVDLSLSRRGVCGLDGQGAVWCADSASPALAPVAGLPALGSIVAAGEGTAHCGLAKNDSTAWCFVPDSAAPLAVPGGQAFTQLRMEQQRRYYEVCGLHADSTAACWVKGVLSVGPIATPETPTALPGGLRFTALAKGRLFACGRDPAAALYCWGPVLTGSMNYSPALSLPVAQYIGAMDDWMQVVRSTDVVQWLPDISLVPGTSFIPPPTGLNVPSLAGYGTNGLACVRLLDGQVYCIDHFWNGQTSLGVDHYAPVPPPRS